MQKTLRITVLLALSLVLSGAGSATWKQGDLPVPHPSAPQIENVLVPAGEFLMGNNDSGQSDEAPQHPVDVKEFRMSRFEVTWEQFQAFIDAGGYENKVENGFWSRKGAFLAEQPIWTTEAGWGQTIQGPRWSPDGEGPVGFAGKDRWPPRPNDPMIGVSYWEAEAFCRFVGGRLPTEAEWEKASSWGPGATSPRTYPWGEDTTTPLPANGFEVCEGGSQIEAVDNPRYEGDCSGYGVCGMGGNVREWVADMYDPDFYSQAPNPEALWDNPFNYQAKRYDQVDEVGGSVPAMWVTRGSTFRWNTVDPGPFRCAYRQSEDATARDFDLGFRVVWDTEFTSPRETVNRIEIPGAAIEVPAGTYMMGQTEGAPSELGSRANESPQHAICLDNYWIGIFEVTWYEYKKYMEAGGYGTLGGPKPEWWSADGWEWRTNPPGSYGTGWFEVTQPDIFGVPRPLIGYDRFVLWKGPWLNLGEFSTPPDDHPVMGLSWYEAEAYCRYVGGRLPTEAEWEVAATWNPETGRPMQFPWGNLFTFHHESVVANTGDDPKYPGSQTSPVGMYPEGRSPLGCYDMSGNVFEWTQDWFHPDSYSQHPTECGVPVVTPDWMKIESPHDPGQSPVPGYKVNRGGGFDPAFEGTYSQRGRTRGTDGAMDFRNYSFGFRVAWDQDPSTIANAQAVRPPSESGTDSPAREAVDDIPAPPPPSGCAPVFPTFNTTLVEEVIDFGGKEDWYRVNGPAGALVEIDLDANGGAEDPTEFSPLDAVIEIWQPGYDAPVIVRDDEIIPISVNHRDVYLDPPVIQHRIPEQGYFWVKVRAYYWPAEGSQAGLPVEDRSYWGPDYVYTIGFKAPSVSDNSPAYCPDLNGDGKVDTGDLFTVVEGAKSTGSKRLKADLDGDGFVTGRDIFTLQDLWNNYGAVCGDN